MNRLAQLARNLNTWMIVALLAANGLAWLFGAGQQAALPTVEPRLDPELADLRERLIAGDAHGQPFRVVLTDQDAAESIAWYLSRHPRIPFGNPQVEIQPGGVEARGEAYVGGLRVGLSGRAGLVLRYGVPVVTVQRLDIAGLSVPRFVRDQIQAELDAQLDLSDRELPVVVEGLELQVGQAVVWGTIR